MMIRSDSQRWNFVFLLHLSSIIIAASPLLRLVVADQAENDRQALLCFKSHVSDPSGALASWRQRQTNTTTSPQHCSWEGVSCTTQRRVTVVAALSLPSIGLAAGSELPPCLTNLTSLETLQLSNNGFRGVVPAELGELSMLTYLNLSGNSLSGIIPSTLSSCTKLQVLDLSNNSLEGEIPVTLSNCLDLQDINLSNNKLQGSIPTGFGTLPNLQTLVLSGNRLTGGIPPLLGSSSTLSLIHVDFGANRLTGEMPASLASSSSLQVLRLMGNSFSGELPLALFNTSSLVAICLQKNNFSGGIPPVTAITRPPVKYLSIRENSLSGQIPPSLGNLTSLVYLMLHKNNLVGSIPESLARISTLERVSLNGNHLSGLVPPSLFNMSSLTYLGFGNNSLIGKLPSNIGNTLPSIQTLVLTSNRFDGTIPASLTNASNLQQLHLADNRLTGLIPLFGSLPNLKALDISTNMLEAGEWSFLASLSNCTSLEILTVHSNNLQGNLPRYIGNLSNSLQVLSLTQNKLSGPIPLEIGNLKNLTVLSMDYNLFRDSIPATIVNLRKLVVLSIAQNKLSGQLPDAMGNLVQLNELSLDGNNFSGHIPPSIGHCSHLEKLNLSHYSLFGNIPRELFKISSLSQYLDLSYNHLSGEIPQEAGNLINLGILSISNNRLSGNIPSTLGQCVLLESLQMQSNSLVGSIPESFMNLVGLKILDVSQNNLSGHIPGSLKSLSNLLVLNISFNNFDGPIPTGGAFSNSSILSLQGNERLCTNVPELALPLCPISVNHKRKHNSLVLKVVIPVVFVAFITLSCLVTILRRRRRKLLMSHYVQSNQSTRKITFQDIAKATNQFSSANLIGSGSFGTVYKGYLELEDNIVAIKIFNLDIFGANKSFDAECGTLKNIRHRNLVKVITLCSTFDSTGTEFKAIVFKYMPNGSLEMWLHPKVGEQGLRRTLTLIQRINIALDIALALDCLHNQCACPIIHCDLKPSNVLLDLDMTACIGDFGLAKFLSTNAQHNTSASLTRLKGSIGYIAPEYGVSVDISTKGDIYSFGVLLLEMITGNRPTDEKFYDGTTMHEFVYKGFPNNIYEIVDPVLLHDESNATHVMQNCIIPLVKIGLSCSMTSPKARWEMGRVCVRY
uniref:Receptor kinase-like protein Xa21 n=1 Tax=Leersia perrieri TaxID=77586 RepID=A0A0D9WRL4_9ORYZ